MEVCSRAMRTIPLNLFSSWKFKMATNGWLSPPLVTVLECRIAREHPTFVEIVKWQAVH